MSPPSRAFICFLVSICFSTAATATELRSLSGERSQLAEHIQTPHTLILVVKEETDLQEAQRILTLAVSRQAHALILISLEDQPSLQAAAIRQAAKAFFSSAFSRQRVYFIDGDSRFLASKALLFAAEKEEPLWKSESYPEDDSPLWEWQER